MPTRIIEEVSSRVYPGLDRSPKKNWVDRAGGLPSYIERIAKHIHYEGGKSISNAIAAAVNTVKRWCAGGSVTKKGASTANVTAKTKALACKAVAQWEAKKARSKTEESVWDVIERLELQGERLSVEEERAVGRRAAAQAVEAAAVLEVLLPSEEIEEANIADAMGRAFNVILDPHAERLLVESDCVVENVDEVRRALLECFVADYQIAQTFGYDPARAIEEAADQRAKGRGGQPVKDREFERKHPRAAKGRTGGGKWIQKGDSGKEVQRLQRRVGVKPDGEFGPKTEAAVRRYQREHDLKVDGVVGPQTKDKLAGGKGEGNREGDGIDRAPIRTDPSKKPTSDKKDKDPTGRSTGTSSSGGGAASNSSSDGDRSSSAGTDPREGTTISSGASGPVVKAIQEKLGIKATGQYDERTVKAIKEYQRSQGLTVDGIIGSQTAASLLGQEEQPPGPLSAEIAADLDAFAGNDDGGKGGKRKVQEARLIEEAGFRKGPGGRWQLRDRNGRWINMPDAPVSSAQVDDFQHAGPGGDRAMPSDVRAALDRLKPGQGVVIAGVPVTRQENGDFNVEGDANLASPWVAMSSVKMRRGSYDPFGNRKSLREAAEGAEGTTSQADLHLAAGAQGTRVSQMQSRLGSLGHRVKADGVFGDRTSAAVQQFQKEAGLKEDGIVGDQTIGAMRTAGSERGDLHRKGDGVVGEPDEKVRELQAVLTSTGFDAGEEDGRFGPETEKAVRRLQRRYGLRSDGIAGPRTLTLLDRIRSRQEREAAEDDEEDTTDE